MPMEMLQGLSKNSSFTLGEKISIKLNIVQKMFEHKRSYSLVKQEMYDK